MRIQRLDLLQLVAVAIGVGLALGVLTQIGQSVLPEGLGQVANSISVWVAVAFFVGAIASTPRLASVVGFVTLVAALVGYYGMIWIRFGYTGGGSSLILWTVGALLGGFVFGPAGWYWRWTSGNVRIAAIALLAAVFVAEGLYLLRHPAREGGRQRVHRGWVGHSAATRLVVAREDVRLAGAGAGGVAGRSRLRGADGAQFGSGRVLISPLIRAGRPCCA